MSRQIARNSGSVLIVGAGGTGLVAALELNRWGVDVTIIDALAEPMRESRAGGVQPRTLELLDRYGVAEDIRDNGPGGQAFVQFRHQKEIGRVDLTKARSRFACPPPSAQARTEGILRHKLHSLGIEVLWNHRLVDLRQEDTHIIASLVTPAGPVEFQADWLIGNDGARSTVRKTVGLEFAGISYPEAWGLMDVKLDSELHVSGVHTYRLDGPQQFVIAPYNNGYTRVQLDNRPEEIADVKPTLAEMQDAFDRFTGMKGVLRDPVWSSAFSLHRRSAVTYRSGRALLGGDAAHIHTPAGAQGLNTGIQDAINLGWKLGLVISGQADDALIDTYDAERKPIAEHVLELAETLARRPETLLFDPSIPQEALANRFNQLDVNYRNSVLGQPSRGPRKLGAGDRLPYTTDETAAVYTALKEPTIILAVFGDEGDVLAATAKLDLPSAVSIARFAADGDLASEIGIASGAAVIRPDAYLGLVVEGSPEQAAREAAAWIVEALHIRVESLQI